MKIQNKGIHRLAKRHFCQQFIRAGKGIFIFSHKQIGHDIHHTQTLAFVILHNHMTGTRKSGIHIFRPQQARLGGHIGADFRLVKGMIARGKHINTGCQQPVANRRGYPKTAGGIFTIGDDKITLQFCTKLWYALYHRLASRTPDNIP